MIKAHIISLIIWMVLIPSCTDTQESQSLDQQAKDAINNHIETMLKAFNDRDLNAWMNEIAADAVWFVPDQDPIYGKNSVRAFYEPSLNSLEQCKAGYCLNIRKSLSVEIWLLLGL